MYVSSFNGATLWNFLKLSLFSEGRAHRRSFTQLLCCRRAVPISTCTGDLCSTDCDTNDEVGVKLGLPTMTFPSVSVRMMAAILAPMDRGLLPLASKFTCFISTIQEKIFSTVTGWWIIDVKVKKKLRFVKQSNISKMVVMRNGTKNPKFSE